MCFRPATADTSGTCPFCGKKVNAVMGNFPDECPFCEGKFFDSAEMPAAAQPSAPIGAPGAPKAPSAPKPPCAPKAPDAPKPPGA